MSQPTGQQLHVDHYLTDVAVAWAQDEANFIAPKVFPIVPVAQQSNYYAIYQKGFFYRAGQMLVRPLGGRPTEIGYEVEKGQYLAEEWSLEYKIDDRTRATADQPYDPDLAATRLLMTQSMIQRDTLWTNTFFNTGIWGTDWTGVAANPSGNQFLQWDQSGSDPIQFIRARANDVAGKTGYRPNTLTFGPTAFEAFTNHSTVVDRIKYTQRGIVTEDIVAELLGIPKVLVARGVSNTAHEGQTDNIGYITTPTSVMMAFAAPAPSLTQPSAGYTFAWTGLVPGVNNAFGGVIERGREELAHSDVFQVRGAYDQKVVASDLGEFFQDVVSAGYSESTY